MHSSVVARIVEQRSGVRSAKHRSAGALLESGALLGSTALRGCGRYWGVVTLLECGAEMADTLGRWSAGWPTGRNQRLWALGRLSAGRREVLIRIEIATDELYVGGRDVRILRVGGAGQISKNRTPGELEIPISVCFCQAAKLFEATDEHKRLEPKTLIL